MVGEGSGARGGARVAVHTHVKGLGLGKDGTAAEGPGAAEGFVGQRKAREALGIVADLVRAHRLAGRAVLLAGPPGTGKTALARGLAAELGPKVPFCQLAAPAVYSAEVKKTAVLTEHLRRAIGLRVRETKEVYEGEVTEIAPEFTQNPLAGYASAVAHVALTLRTTQGTRTLRLDPAVHDALVREGVTPGDVIYIEANTGAVKRVGRSDAFAAEHDLEADEYVPVPKGDVHKRKDVVQDLTLHDLDAANARPAHSGADLAGTVSQLLRPRQTEITDKLRREVDRVVDGYLQQGIAELVPGVLFIDEVHVLDAECFAFLNRALESPNAPIVVFATNRARAPVRGSATVSPHGIPADLLDRTLIIRTAPYSDAELCAIIQLRAATEGTALDPPALARLGTLARRTSLRYALMLLSPIRIIAKSNGSSAITVADIDEADHLFSDAKRSADLLTRQKDKFLS